MPDRLTLILITNLDVRLKKKKSSQTCCLKCVTAHFCTLVYMSKRAKASVILTSLLPVKIAGNVHVFILEYADCHEYRNFPVTLCSM